MIELTIFGDNYPLLDLVLTNFKWIKLIRSSHIDLNLIQKDHKVKVMILFIDNVPTAEIEILIHRESVLVLKVIILVEIAYVLWIKFGRDLSQIDIGS